MSEKHVIIIGGGIIGTCCAYFLSKHANYKITLLEKVDIACAASGKAGGFLALDWNDDHPGMKALTRASFQLHAQLAKELNGETTYGYRRMNTYSVIFDSSLEKGEKSLDWIHKNSVRSFDQIGTTSSTAQLTPELFTKALLEEAKKTGRMDVKIGQGVSELVCDGETVVGVKLENGEEIKGDQVVVAMGPWSGFLPMPKPGEKIPVRGSHVHSIILKPDDSANILNQALFTAILDKGKTYEPEVYPRSDGTVYICGAGDKEKLPPSADLVTADEKAIKLLTYQASLISPELTDKPVIKEQACYLPISEHTQLPLIGHHPKYKQLVLATGHSFWGILNAPITGKIISELLTSGEITSIDKKSMKFFTPK